VLSAHDPRAHALRRCRETWPALRDARGGAGVLFELTHRFLAGAGYSAYEVSNFARSRDHESRHNRKYWDHTPYLGLGPSAHSLAEADSGAGPAGAGAALDGRAAAGARRAAAGGGTSCARRGGRPRGGGERPVEGEEPLGPKALATEAVMLGLRTTAGIDLDAFATRYGVDLLAANEALVARLTAEGRLALHEGARRGRRLVPTVSGLAVADGMAARSTSLFRPIRMARLAVMCQSMDVMSYKERERRLTPPGSAAAPERDQPGGGSGSPLTNRRARRWPGSSSSARCRASSG